MKKLSTLSFSIAISQYIIQAIYIVYVLYIYIYIYIYIYYIYMYYIKYVCEKHVQLAI